MFASPPARNWNAKHAFRLAGTSLLLVAACACRASDSPARDGGAGLTRAALLAAFADCARSTTVHFRAAAADLDSASAAVVADPGPAAREAARASFRGAFSIWQAAELMQFGPAARSNLPGGRDLRDHIYSWPLAGRCAVEEQIVTRGYEDPGLPQLLVNRRGLAAIEYLLFYQGEDSACPASSTIISSGSWAALSSEERDARKRAYAAAAAADVHARAAALAAAWDPEEDNFGRTLAGAGPGNQVFRSTQAALNAVSDALFYLEREVKDLKLARPLALRDCETDTCPELLEARFAALSRANIVANVEGFRRLVLGCGDGFDGLGFDDLLDAVGAGSVTERLRAGLSGVDTTLASIDGPDLEPALAQNTASVRAVYDALKVVTDLLKTEFATVLDLELPMGIEGDND